MNKKQLLKILNPFPDDAEICRFCDLRHDGDGSTPVETIQSESKTEGRTRIIFI